jgi:hypothetical protein
MGIQIVKPPKQTTFINKIKSSSKNSRRCFLPVGRNCKDLFRSFLKFDLSSLPPFLTIINATLNLHLVENNFPSCQKTVTVHQILSEWNARTLSFKHQPLYNSTPVSSVSLTNQNKSLVSFDLTPLIQLWYSGIEANLGVMLKTSDEAMHEIVFLSKEYPNSKFWPYLEVDFLNSANNSCPQSIDITINAITEDHIRSTTPINTLMFNFTYIVVNTGSAVAIAFLQSSPDSCHWGPESATKTIKPGQTENLVPDFIAKYSRLCYQSTADNQSTTLKIHIQGRS